MIKVHAPSYGLHWIVGDIGVLIQAGPSVANATGVDLDIEVVLGIKNRPVCPHKIDLDDRLDHPLPDHPLIEAALPLPKTAIGKPLMVVDTPDNRTAISNLLRLSSSDGTAAWMPFWTIDMRKIPHHLMLTNLTPLIIYGYRYQNHKLLDRLIETMPLYHRPVILLGQKFELPAGPKMDPQAFNLDGLPLEKIGTHRLYQRMINP